MATLAVVNPHVSSSKLDRLSEEETYNNLLFYENKIEVEEFNDVFKSKV